MSETKVMAVAKAVGVGIGGIAALTAGFAVEIGCLALTKQYNGGKFAKLGLKLGAFFLGTAASVIVGNTISKEIEDWGEAIEKTQDTISEIMDTAKQSLNAVEDEENGETKDEPEKTDEEPDYTKHDDKVNNPQGCMIRVDEHVYLTNIESVWGESPDRDMCGYERIELHHFEDLSYEGSMAEAWLSEHYSDRIATLMLKAAIAGKKLKSYYGKVSKSYLIDYQHEIFVTLMVHNQ